MYRVDIQQTIAKELMPSSSQLKKWAKKTLQEKIPSAELTIRVVDEAEISELNSTYRHKNYATNVLSFPSDLPPEMNDGIPLLGDIVICAAVVNQEALSQHKTPDAHWAHMIVHGTLHLLGFDHEDAHEADLMEAEEITILAALGFPNPYLVSEQGESQ